ncbi:MAG: A/G-specific adenine glycosylase [Tannerellaceae bacterium]|nr:A/G-specific adenine glycosylase [Tannerellaceae bacterium]
MSEPDKSFEISHLLIQWYHSHQRDLPWRKTTDPYPIWISEIILQQTRVAQGMDYFLRFMERFPNVQALAGAAEDEVLKYWQGLGYYSRARNLHAAAKTIVTAFGGVFPTEYTQVLSLKGVGEYTAAAIVSFSANQPYPVVDGNVYRVLSRLFAIDTPMDTGKGKKEFTRLAGLLMDPAQAGTHNQAIMEFGALQCIPRHPDCPSCPLQEKCLAYATRTVQDYPVKQNKTKTRNRYFHYFHILCQGYTWLNRRSGKDIWTGLYEFPLIETDQPADWVELERTESFRKLFTDTGCLTITRQLQGVRHVLSHQVLYTNFYTIEIEQEGKGLAPYLKIKNSDLDTYAVSRLMELYGESGS